MGMTIERAFVKAWPMHGIQHDYGITGSAMISISDPFPNVRPELQGLAQHANDLSRGCSCDDIIKMITITAVQVGDRPAVPPALTAREGAAL